MIEVKLTAAANTQIRKAARDGTPDAARKHPAGRESLAANS